MSFKLIPLTAEQRKYSGKRAESKNINQNSISVCVNVMVAYPWLKVVRKNKSDWLLDIF